MRVPIPRMLGLFALVGLLMLTVSNDTAQAGRQTLVTAPAGTQVSVRSGPLGLGQRVTVNQVGVAPVQQIVAPAPIVSTTTRGLFQRQTIVNVPAQGAVALTAQPAFVHSQVLAIQNRRHVSQLNLLNTATYTPANVAANIAFTPGNQVYLTAPPIVAAPIQTQYIIQQPAQIQAQPVQAAAPCPPTQPTSDPNYLKQAPQAQTAAPQPVQVQAVQVQAVQTPVYVTQAPLAIQTPVYVQQAPLAIVTNPVTVRVTHQHAFVRQQPLAIINQRTVVHHHFHHGRF